VTRFISFLPHRKIFACNDEQDEERITTALDFPRVGERGVVVSVLCIIAFPFTFLVAAVEYGRARCVGCRCCCGDRPEASLGLGNGINGPRRWTLLGMTKLGFWSLALLPLRRLYVNSYDKTMCSAVMGGTSARFYDTV
jgi:hypothetical protein